MSGPQVVPLEVRGKIRPEDLQGIRGLPEVVVYMHDQFQGSEFRTNLAVANVGDEMNDKISAVIVVSGTWRFYEHGNFEGKYIDLVTGYYRSISAARDPAWNDRVSSFEPIAL